MTEFGNMATSRPKPPTIRVFFITIWEDWSTRVSGSLSVPFTLLALLLGNQYARVLFACLAILGIGFTVYKVWARERLTVVTKHAELEREIARQARPDFRGEIREVHFEGNWSGLPPECYCAVVLKAYLVNHSAPANIKNYRLSVEKEGRIYNSVRLINANQHWQLAKKQRRTLPSGGIGEKIVNEDLLDLSMRIGTVPLPPGRGEDGWLGFDMGDTEIGELAGGTFTLIVVDAYGVEHHISSSGPWTNSGKLVERTVGASG